MNAMPPSCEELFEQSGCKSILRETNDGWKHGVYVTQIFHRLFDDTYWQASYRLSTNGETNELASGLAIIRQMKPVKKLITVYERL